MAVKAIANSYWRSIQRGRDFAAIPDSVKDDVRTLAAADVESGAISPEKYEEYLGEPYPDTEE